jgi:hypothetical protein
MIAKLFFGSMLACAAAGVLVVGAGACSIASSGGEPPAACPNLDFPTTCPSPPPSWKGDVQALFEGYCYSCHGNGGPAAAQVPLATYSDVFDNRTRAWQQIANCSMPNTDASLPATSFPTAAQRQTMVTWLDICSAPNN